jgi:hypothetical protein
MTAKMSGSEKVGRVNLEIAGCPSLTLWTCSVGGALCDQQVSSCAGIEGYQHGESYSADAVRFKINTNDVRGYAEGGILSVTSRILVVDLLSSTLRALSCSAPY